MMGARSLKTSIQNRGILSVGAVPPKVQRAPQFITGCQSTCHHFEPSATAGQIERGLEATCPDKEFRNSVRATEMATIVCERTAWRFPLTILTLAAARAESGDLATAKDLGIRGGCALATDRVSRLLTCAHGAETIARLSFIRANIRSRSSRSPPVDLSIAFSISAIAESKSPALACAAASVAIMCPSA